MRTKISKNYFWKLPTNVYEKNLGLHGHVYISRAPQTLGNQLRAPGKRNQLRAELLAKYTYTFAIPILLPGERWEH